MEKEERKYTITEIKKYNKKLKNNDKHIILATTFAIASIVGITFSSNSLLVKILGFLILSGSLFTIGVSIYEKKGLKKQRETLVNRIKFDKLESSYSEDLEIEEQKIRTYYKEIKKQK